MVNSLFGLPWLVAATVRSINHVQVGVRARARARARARCRGMVGRYCALHQPRAGHQALSLALALALALT